MSVSTGQAPIHSIRVLVDRVATTIFCLAALSFGWWLGARPSHSEPAPVAQAAAPGRYFLCNSESESDCEDAYETYLDTERARAQAWRHGGP